MSPTLRLLSLGAGVQSTTLALLAIEGTLPAPDAAIFADTGWEPRAVYEHLDRLGVELDRAGIRLHRVSAGDLRADAIDPVHRYASVPYFVRNADGSEGMGRRQCTSEYKLGPINRKVRELLGATAPDFRRVSRGRVAEQWIGFSTDEIERVSDRPGVRYLRSRYPLLELGMSRKDCVRIRKGGARGLPLDGEAFLHRSRVPLDVAPIDRVTRAEWHDRQGDLLDLITEQGDPDGCSPYGCRSGPAAP
jgi:hypothetical protein